MLVSDAAKKLKMNTQTLRLALQQGLFPFGVAVKTSENRYTYYINRNRLEKYLEGGNEKNYSLDMPVDLGVDDRLQNGYN